MPVLYESLTAARAFVYYQLNVSCLGNDRRTRSVWISWTREGGEFGFCGESVLSETVGVLPLTFIVIALTKSRECFKL
jgi:hypothetical protein